MNMREEMKNIKKANVIEEHRAEAKFYWISLIADSALHNKRI